MANALQKYLAVYTHKHPVAFSGQSIVSFSFDDFPHSALEHGGALLEAHNARGTFYASAKLTVSEDLIACAQRGHELACHTYDHMDCARHSAADIAASMERNAATIATPLQHFAYPYGSLSLTAKQEAMRHYRSARSVQHGINRGIIDRGCLKACPLYSHLGMQGWRPYLQSLAKKPGWLIFYTHDISSSPSRYGCTPEEFQAVIASVVQMQYAILPVGEAVRQLSQHQER